MQPEPTDVAVIAVFAMLVGLIACGTAIAALRRYLDDMKRQRRKNDC